ncbi:VOC family protein [Cereibacter sphaeroides]|nr:VOC family protein [Cereibacter sphaeroides]
MGGFVWHELTTPDPDGTVAFYGRLLGWEAQPFPGSDPPYRVMMAGGAGVAGIYAAKAPQPPGWIGYIHVEDVEAASIRIEASGGRFEAPAEDMEGIGRMLLSRDPDGAAFVLMTPAPRGEMPRPAEGAPGAPIWDELYASDVERAFAFYAGFAGWTRDSAMDMGDMGTYQMFAAGGPAIGGIMRRPEQMMPPGWLVYFTIASVTASIALAQELGATHLFGPQEVPGEMWIAQFLDPQGHMFGLVGPHG